MTKLGYLVRRRYTDDRDETANEWFTEFTNKHAGDAEKEPEAKTAWTSFVVGPDRLDKRQHRMWANTFMTNMPRVVESLCEAKELVAAVEQVDAADEGVCDCGAWYEVVAATYEGQGHSPSMIQLEGPVSQVCK